MHRLLDAGTKFDLKWLAALDVPGMQPTIPGADSDVTRLDLSELIDHWQAGGASWRRRVKRAWRKFLAQESMMYDLRLLHKDFFRTLQEHDATFSFSPFHAAHTSGLDHKCWCGRAFTTAQGLACHKRIQHQEFAPEHAYIKGTVCPICLKFFWTRQRLYLHLAYVPRGTGINQCFQLLSLTQYHDSPDTTESFQRLPPEARGLARVETLQTFGPLPEWVDPREHLISDTKKTIERLQDALIISDMPPDPDQAAQELHCKLSQATHDWFVHFCDEGFDEACIDSLPDLWIAELGGPDGDFDQWYEAEFLKWGRDGLPLVLEQFMDGVAENLVDNAFAELVAIFPRSECLSQLAFSRAKLDRLLEELQQRFPHREVKTGNANVRERAITAATVSSLFEEQSTFFAGLQGLEWTDLPREASIPIWRQPTERPVYLIAHLFSGRRRQGGVHTFLHYWAERAQLQIVVLSLDTANSPSHGNLQTSSVTWGKLLRLYREGRIAATLTGAPCETWSAARHNAMPEDSDNPSRQVRWPRPLRSAARIFGLAGLTARELRQVGQGTQFYMQTILTIAWAICTGGLYVSEHPAPPHNQEIASVWTTPWSLFLRKHPDVHLHIVGQWQWGCEVRKPTGLLALRLPYFLKSLYNRALPDARPPTTVAIGVGDDGRFRTSAFKEYPSPFCSALAGVLIDEIKRSQARGSCTYRSSPDPDLVEWVNEAEMLCGQIRQGATWLPDFQDR